MKVNIPRENVIDLMKDIRNAIFDKIDLKKYFDADMENLLKSHTEENAISYAILNMDDEMKRTYDSEHPG